MGYPTDADVFDLISDYKQDFGPTLPFEDARRLLVLYQEMFDLFEKHLTPEERGEHDFLLDYDLRG